ncbi:MAG: hypothetical protein ACREKL_05135, partial [Chthoniobacterales bacterium]
MRQVFAYAALTILAALTGRLEAHIIALTPSPVEVIVPVGVNHAEVRVALSLDNPELIQNATVLGTSDWVKPSLSRNTSEIVLTFNTSKLAAGNYTTLIQVSDSVETKPLTVNLHVQTMSVTKLLDDPMRSRTYAIHYGGRAVPPNGAVIVYDPIKAVAVSAITVGLVPTDLSESADGKELYVINTQNPSITVIDLAKLVVKETIQLKAFIPGPSNAHIKAGPGGILYYTDGGSAATLRVFDRKKKGVIQTVTSPGRTNGSALGFGDFAVSHDLKSLFTCAQSAGIPWFFFAKYSIADDGRLTLAESTNGASVNPLLRSDDSPIPVTIASDDSAVFIQKFAISPSSILTNKTVFASPICAITPGGEIALSNDRHAYLTATGKLVGTIGFIGDSPSSPPVVVTSDYAKIVYVSGGAIRSTTLSQAIPSQSLDLSASPRQRATALPTTQLKWAPHEGVDLYDVYLSRNSSEVADGTVGSKGYLGTVAGRSVSLPSPLEAGAQYFWKADQVLENGTIVKGTVMSFIVASVIPAVGEIRVFASQDSQWTTTINISSRNPGEAWSAYSQYDYIHVTESGTTPGTMTVTVNASHLPAGITTATIYIRQPGESLAVPVTIKVEPLAVTILKSDPQSKYVYAISEKTSDPAAHAYLLELDAESEKITRSVDVGFGVTDMAIHADDDMIYVTNWTRGLLLGIDRTTFEIRRTYAFKPGRYSYAGPTSGDVYRVSVGPKGRLVLEEVNSPNHISLFDLENKKVLSTISANRGGGASAALGYIYYHGDNSGDAKIHRYSLVNDTFTEETSNSGGLSSSGSRIVLSSTMGRRVAWNGSAFDQVLIETAEVKENIYALSDDGRFALTNTSIIDLDGPVPSQPMPIPTTVSAINNTTGKAVMWTGKTLSYYDLVTPAFAVAPTLTGDIVGPNGKVHLKWNDQWLETGYRLQYRVVGDENWTDVNDQPPADATEGNILGLGTDRICQFRIRAERGDLVSPWSDTLTINLSDAPKLSIVSATKAGITLRWTQTPDATSYDVVRGPYGLGTSGILILIGSDGRPVATPVIAYYGTYPPFYNPPNDLVIPDVIARGLPADTTSFTDTDVRRGSDIQYTVIAHTDSRTLASNTQSAYIPITDGAPTRPDNFTATRDGTTVRLAWQDVQTEVH